MLVATTLRWYAVVARTRDMDGTVLLGFWSMPRTGEFTLPRRPLECPRSRRVNIHRLFPNRSFDTHSWIGAASERSSAKTLRGSQ